METSPTVIAYRHKQRRSSLHFHRPRTSSKNVWQSYRSSTGQIYYYNSITDQSQWEKPSRRRSSKIPHSSKKKCPLMTPTSPPFNEIIPLAHVDPILTEPNSIIIPAIDEQPLSLQPSESTVNAIFQLEHLPRILSSEEYEKEILLYQLVSLRTDLYFLRLRFNANRLRISKNIC